MQQIADQVGCTVNKIVYRMQQSGLECRDRSEATYAHWNPNGDRFAIKTPETVEEKEFLALAIGLYMGEGTKKGIYSVALANTNPKILQVFIRFLTEVCGVDKNNLQAALNIFDDCDVDEALQWWSKEVDIRVEQFFRPIIRTSRSGTYKNKSKYGTLTITFGNIKLKKVIDDWCSEYYQRFTSNLA